MAVLYAIFQAGSPATVLCSCFDFTPYTAAVVWDSHGYSQPCYTEDGHFYPSYNTAYTSGTTYVGYTYGNAEAQCDWGEVDVYHISASVDGGHGTIVPSGDVPVNAGSDLEFNFYPDEHYVVSDVIVDGSSVGSPSSYTFYDIAADHTIVVKYTTCLVKVPSNKWWFY